MPENYGSKIDDTIAYKRGSSIVEPTSEESLATYLIAYITSSFVRLAFLVDSRFWMIF